MNEFTLSMGSETGKKRKKKAAKEMFQEGRKQPNSGGLRSSQLTGLLLLSCFFWFRPWGFFSKALGRLNL